MSLATPVYSSGSNTDNTKCTRCKSKQHNTPDCKAQFCLICNMMCMNKFHNRQRSDASQEPTYCKYCKDTHQFGAYTSSMADLGKMDFSNPTHRSSRS